jgi:hypothetical protein
MAADAVMLLQGIVGQHSNGGIQPGGLRLRVDP